MKEGGGLPDFLKANSFVQSKCSEWILCAERCVKSYKKHVELERQQFKLWQIYEISASFSCLAFISQKIAQILKYFAKSCDCMIAAFRNSGFCYQRFIERKYFNIWCSHIVPGAP